MREREAPCSDLRHRVVWFFGDGTACRTFVGGSQSFLLVVTLGGLIADRQRRARLRRRLHRCDPCPRCHTVQTRRGLRFCPRAAVSAQIRRPARADPWHAAGQLAPVALWGARRTHHAFDVYPETFD